MKNVKDWHYQRLKCAHCPLTTSCPARRAQIKNRHFGCIWNADETTPISTLFFLTGWKRHLAHMAATKERREKMFAFHNKGPSLEPAPTARELQVFIYKHRQ